jgi:hypothetical protein
MLGDGLLPSAIVTVVLIIVAYVKFGKDRIEKSELQIYLVVGLAVEALAWLGKRYNSIGSFLMVGMVLVFSAVTLRILNRPHPGESRLQGKLAVGVCVIVALLCWLSLRTTVEVDTQVKNNDLVLTLRAKFKENPAMKATSEWKDAFGHNIASGSPLSEAETVMPIQGEHLVVRVVDSVGASEVYDYYFAPWAHGFDVAQNQVVAQDSGAPENPAAQ